MNKVSFFRSIQLKFIIIYILLLLVAVQVIGSYFVRQLETELLDNFKTSINDRVELLRYNLEQTFKLDSQDDDKSINLEKAIQETVSDIGTDTNTKLQVINSKGRVLATDDYVNSDIVGKRTTEELIQKTLMFGTIEETNVKRSSTDERLYIKVSPLTDDEDNVLGAVYLESSLEGVYNQLANINKIFLQGSILAIIVSAFIGILVARTITKPIMEMKQQAQVIATGDFTKKVNVYGQDEIGQLAETFNDMTDRLKHSYQTIQEEEKKLSSVLSNMSDGVIASDDKGTITLMNEAAGRLLRMNPTQAIGRPLMDILRSKDESIEIDQLENDSSRIIDFSKGNRSILIQATFSHIIDDYDKVTGLITVLSDVTEQERIEEERREFVSNVSHELRTPLTTMRSYLEALLDGAWKDETIAPRFLDVTQIETDRMIRMVNDLLQLSRADNKEYELKKEHTNFIPFLEQVIERFELNTSENENIKFTRDFPNESFYVWIDKDKMVQVLDNIISNAIKYSPEGGAIAFIVRRERNQLLVRIKDEGLGIEYNHLEKIFDRFYRTDKNRTRKLGGTGLGLAITKEIIEAHYGRIWANSKKGEGTIISFTLPLVSPKRRLER